MSDQKPIEEYILEIRQLKIDKERLASDAYVWGKWLDEERARTERLVGEVASLRAENAAHEKDVKALMDKCLAFGALLREAQSHLSEVKDCPGCVHLIKRIGEALGEKE